MLFRPQIRLFSIFALLFAIAQASWLDANVYGREIDARQEGSGTSDVSLGTGRGGSPPSADSTLTTPQEQTPAPTPTPTTTPSSSISSVPPPTTTTTSPSPPEVTATSPSATPSTSASSTPSRTSSAPAEETSSTSTGRQTVTKTTAKVTPAPTTFVVVNTIVRTQDGSTFISLASSTVTSTLPTGTAALNSDGSPKGSSGMSTKTRNTIIGVVVGIGGAILLAGLGVVAFRIWGRRRNLDENDGLMSFGNTGHEKPGTATGSGNTGPSPFTSTLENYHNPARNGNVNASSNF